MPYVRIYNQQKHLAVTKENLNLAQRALKAYVAMNGAYPCPAGINLPRNHPLFGKAAASCLIFEQNAENKMSAISYSKGREDRLVTEGMLPFRSLGLPDNNAADGWRSLFRYAVTASLTNQNGFSQRSGAIDVVSDQGISTLTPSGSAQYVVFSAGENKGNAISWDGMEISPCSVDSLETENCNKDSVFMDTQRRYNKRGKETYVDYDDYIVYEQYDPTLLGKGGLLYFCNEVCASGFVEIPINSAQPVGVEFLGKTSDEQKADSLKLCFSSRYMTTLLIKNSADERNVASCPWGWDKIGYKTFPDEEGIDPQQRGYLVCAY